MWRELAIFVKGLFNSYEPAKHYMRGKSSSHKTHGDL
jgi:hypothetical protein